MQFENPYASPVTTEAEPPLVAVLAPLHPASQGKRFINLIVDRIVTFGLSYASGFALGLAYAFSRSNPTAPLHPDEAFMLNVVDVVQGIIVALTYFIVTEIVWQRSLGKLLTGTRVVTANGGRPTPGQIVGRTFARLIPFEAFSYLSERPVGWHDSLSGTRVVEIR